MASCRSKISQPRQWEQWSYSKVVKADNGEGAAKWKEWRGSVTALPSGEDLTFKNVRNDGAPCKTERGVPLVITTKQMRGGKTGRPSSMPCASAVEASGCESAGGGTSRYLYLSTLSPSVAGWKEGNAVLHWNFWVPAFVPKGLAVGLWAFPNFAISPTVWVGRPSPVLSRAIPPQRRWRGWVSDQSSVKRLSTLSAEGGAYGFQKQKKTLVEKQQPPCHPPKITSPTTNDTASAAEAIDVGLSIREGPSRGVPAKLLEMGCPDPRRYRMSSR